MMGVDAMVGLASLAIAIPGLVQTFIHAGRWLSEKLRAAPGSVQTAQIQDFILFLDRGSMRMTLESVEDLFADTSDPDVSLCLETIVRQMWKIRL